MAALPTTAALPIAAAYLRPRCTTTQIKSYFLSPLHRQKQPPSALLSTAALPIVAACLRPRLTHAAAPHYTTIASSLCRPVKIVIREIFCHVLPMESSNKEKEVVGNYNDAIGDDIPTFVHRIDDDFEFKLGMIFNSEDEVFITYNTYAMNKGFGVRRGQKYIHGKSQELRQCTFLCSCQGYEPYVPPHEERKSRVDRNSVWL
ncbi:hypothetical protein RJ639_044416 [Escallonia herrerae]|uniref:FAR1 domain-containing protein n=1 Tax=Escallonia herrerae TaxID=1293975 RepID=A0AA89B127_9ASTE|nr:hypothetical protein RJ639_044416 [Escallonia herrerae]